MTDLATIDTTIYIGKVAIHQPVTVFTSYIMTVMCFYFFGRIKQFYNGNQAMLNWGRYFIFMGIASIFGSCSHAFFEIHDGPAYKFFWLTMQLLNIFAVYFAQRAILTSVLKNSKFKDYWNASYKIQLVSFIVAALVLHNFLVVVIDGIVGMIPVIIILFMDAKKEKSSLWLASGISILILSAITNITKFSIHVYFNHLDIAHVIIMFNLWVMFLGVKKITTS